MKNKQWKVNYFKGPMPQSHLYVNEISKNSLILFGEISESDDIKAKGMGFYYTDTCNLTYSEDCIVYLEDRGLDNTFQEDFDQDSVDKIIKDMTKPELDTISDSEDEFEGMVNRRDSKTCPKIYPNNHYLIRNNHVYIWCSEHALMVIKMVHKDGLPTIQKTFVWN